jgi:hypothetical protein
MEKLLDFIHQKYPVCAREVNSESRVKERVFSTSSCVQPDAVSPVAGPGFHNRARTGSTMIVQVFIRLFAT